MTQPTKDKAPFEKRSTLSLDSIIAHWRRLSESSTPCDSTLASDILREIEAAPELEGGIHDLSILEKHAGTVDKLLSAIFPELLWTNEIKACIVPWNNHIVKMTPRFAGIVEEHGSPLLNEDTTAEPVFIASAYHAILGTHYQLPIPMGSPFKLRLNNKSTGLVKHYKALGNGDLMDIRVHGELKPLSEEMRTRIKQHNMDLDLLQEAVDINQFEFYGFWIMTLVDITQDEALSELKLKLLDHDSLYLDEHVSEMEYDIHCLFGSTDFSLGFADLDAQKDPMTFKSHFDRSKILPILRNLDRECLLGCEFEPLIKEQSAIVISDTTSIGNQKTAAALSAAGIRSMIVAPLQFNGKKIGMLEFSSPVTDRFSEVDLLKVEQLRPLFTTALKRSLDERKTRIEALIKNRFTSIHPSVEWIFYDRAEEVFAAEEQGETPTIPAIIFKDVIPLYGQADIRNSSVLRNQAIQEDMEQELKAVLSCLELINRSRSMPAVEEMIFRVRQQMERVKEGLRSGDEGTINDLLHGEVHPLLRHFGEQSEDAKDEISTYFSKLDEQLGILYDRRGAYERSVSTINDTIAKTIELENELAQEHFPHYFEKYKTDGVEYNAYLGASIAPTLLYDDVYLRNLRLWQLIVMCTVAKEVNGLQNTLEIPMDVAPLILVHSAPLSIRFRMDEKKFDVDGTYNMRYEIVKKRIDKATINGSSERLTAPHKLSVVVSQEREVQEYMRYFEFLRSHMLITGEVERLILSPMPGATGLEALRVSIDLNHDNELIRDVMELVQH